VWPRDHLITFLCRSANSIPLLPKFITFKFRYLQIQPCSLYCQVPTSIFCKFNPLYYQNQLLAISTPPRIQCVRTLHDGNSSIIVYRFQLSEERADSVLSRVALPAGALPGSLGQLLSLPYRVPAYWLGLRRGTFTCVGWQVTLCDPIWQATSRSCDMGVPINSYTLYPLLPFVHKPHSCCRQTCVDNSSSACRSRATYKAWCTCCT